MTLNYSKTEIMKAIWNNRIIAESDKTKLIEGNHYFPREKVNREYLKESDKHTDCHWKGIASYYDLVVDGKTNKDAAWYYPDPSSEAAEIRDHIAFWRGVEVTE